jgi:hypothetical protein
MILTQEKEDRIYNALVIGMALDDAYIYAGLTAQEIELVAEDTELQLKFKRYIKEKEYGLLKRMDEISQKQAKVGREGATAWMLEHFYPRYSGKPMNDMPDIHLHIDGTDPADYDTVTIMNAPAPKATEETARAIAHAKITEVPDGN